MKKRLIKILTIVMVSMMVLPWIPITSEAASCSVTVSSGGPIGVGETVELTLTWSATDGVSTFGTLYGTITYDPSVIEYVSGYPTGANGVLSLSDYVDGTTMGRTSVSYKLRFKGVGVGTSTVSFTAAEGQIISYEEEYMSCSSSAGSVVVSDPVTPASGNASLASLAISPGSLSPAFSPDVTEYSASVGSDVDRLIVGPQPADGNASYVISGNTGLAEGSNTVTITVTAPDGTTVKKYYIYVTRDAAAPEPTESESETEPESSSESSEEPLEVTINGRIYLIVENPEEKEMIIPEGFEQAAYSYKGREIQAVKGLAKDLVLIALETEDGETRRFYLYDDRSDSFYPFVNIDVHRVAYTIVPLDESVEIPDNYMEDVLTIDDADVLAWSRKDGGASDYCIVYAMNWDGEKGLYLYDRKDHTMLRLSQELLELLSGTASDHAVVSPDDQKDTQTLMRFYEDELQKKSKQQMILLGLCGAMLLALIFVFMFRPVSGRYDEDEEEDDDEADGAEAEEEDMIPPLDEIWNNLLRDEEIEAPEEEEPVKEVNEEVPMPDDRQTEEIVESEEEEAQIISEIIDQSADPVSEPEEEQPKPSAETDPLDWEEDDDFEFLSLEEDDE